MAWRFIQQPNGKFARFSELVDDFTHYDLTEADAVYLCRHDYEMSQTDAEVKVANAVNQSSRFADAIKTIKFRHGIELAKEREIQLAGEG